VAVRILEHLAQCDEWLDITTGAHHLYDDIQRRGRLLARRAAEELWDVWWRRLRVFLRVSELTLYLWENELRKGATLLVDSDIDTSIVGDYCVRTQLFVLDLPGQLGVCGWWVLEARRFVGGNIVGGGVMM
jgi:hypothetical protein